MAAGAAATRDRWLPAAAALVAAAGNHADAEAGHDEQAEHDEHDGHDHATPAEAATEHAEGEAEHAEHAGHEGEATQEAEAGHDDHANESGSGHLHDEAASITLSEQARANMGLELTRVELRPFEKSIAIPGIVVERPGWTKVEVTAPMTGVVTRIHPIQGQTVAPDTPLFDIRLTHEDLLQAQTDFLRTVEELDVIAREVKRLEQVTKQGAVAGKTLLERQYDEQRQQALLRSQRQALLLHGLSAEQIDGIVAGRTLLKQLTIRAPSRDETPHESLQVEQLHVAQGTAVGVGDQLATLADYSELYVEGRAFEQDMAAVSTAAEKGWHIATTLDGGESCAAASGGVKILYVKNTVDADSRTFRFYVPLCNHILREDTSAEGRRFVSWQFKPGQRTEVKVPVEQWQDRIVLPVGAVAKDGAEYYVFEANDGHFDRRAVKVDYRDKDFVVIANDGSLKLGAMVATSAAHQMQLALKNKAGGAVDPHAGHNH
jgi:multidrug efflux pump subunit AcrA (membrane-fusion protein)